MSITTIKQSASLGLGKGVFLLKKYSPELLTATGIVGLLGAGVIASRQTLKLEPIVDKLETDRLTIAELAEDDDSAYSKQDQRKDLIKAYTTAGVEVTKLYGPPVTLAAGSVISICAAYGILQRRNLALVAAYKALESSFVEYRKRVSDELGEERELEIRRGIQRIEKKIDGKKVIEKVQGPVAGDPSRALFDEHTRNWVPEKQYNYLFLKNQQNSANDVLHTRGHVFLNEVRMWLGLEPIPAGQIVGWILSEDGDNAIDFGFMADTQEAAAFRAGLEPSIWLEFNHDGVIWDKI